MSVRGSAAKGSGSQLPPLLSSAQAFTQGLPSGSLSFLTEGMRVTMPSPSVTVRTKPNDSVCVYRGSCLPVAP